MKLTFIFCIFSLMLLCASACSVFAKAPTTPKILFTSTRDGGQREVYIMNPDGSEQVNLTQHRALDQEAVWSPTGDQILFVSNRRDFRPRGNRDLYLMDSDGTNVRRVFKRKIKGWRTDPTWSPNGKQIAYWQRYWNGEGRSGMYLATLGKQDEEFIGKYSSPAWSPDGTEIAFVVSVGPERLSIYLLNLRTRKQKHFFPPDEISTAREPAWSPDGEKLAFMWHQKRVQDEGEIYTLNRAGTDLQELVREPGVGVAAPVWSPRGDALVYRGRLKQVRQTQVFKVELGGRQVEQLTIVGIWNFPTDWFDPAYALSVSPQPHLLTTQWAEVKRE